MEKKVNGLEGSLKKGQGWKGRVGWKREGYGGLKIANNKGKGKVWKDLGR